MPEDGAWVAMWLQRLGMNQAQLARALGVARSTVSRWEQGGHVDHPTVLRLALERLEQLNRPT